MPINLFQPRERGKLFPAKSREVGERLAALGDDAGASSPEQLAEHVKVELARYGGS